MRYKVVVMVGIVLIVTYDFMRWRAKDRQRQLESLTRRLIEFNVRWSTWTGFDNPHASVPRAFWTVIVARMEALDFSEDAFSHARRTWRAYQAAVALIATRSPCDLDVIEDLLFEVDDGLNALEEFVARRNRIRLQIENPGNRRN